jgi:hypothetical protein
MGNVAADTMMTVVVDTMMMTVIDSAKSGDPDETAKVADITKAETRSASSKTTGRRNL